MFSVNKLINNRLTKTRTTFVKLVIKTVEALFVTVEIADGTVAAVCEHALADYFDTNTLVAPKA